MFRFFLFSVFQLLPYAPRPNFCGETPPFGGGRHGGEGQGKWHFSIALPSVRLYENCHPFYFLKVLTLSTVKKSIRTFAFLGSKLEMNLISLLKFITNNLLVMN
jgi:hypothetical protein